MNLILRFRLACTLTAAALMLFALPACHKKTDLQAEKYATVAEASQALNTESEAIDRLILQLGKVKNPAEEKKLSCEQIPAHYDKMLSVIDANQHLMTDADQKVQRQFRQLAEQQKIRFQSYALCKTPR